MIYKPYVCYKKIITILYLYIWTSYMKNYFIHYFTKKSKIIKVLNNHYNIVKYWYKKF